MIIKSLISVIIVFSIVACTENRSQGQPKQDTPKALEDKNTSYEIASNRGYEDIIENIYKEEVGKNNELRLLEENIENLKGSQGDSTKLYNYYTEKNKMYFVSADRHILEIKDSIVRGKMKSLIATNLTKYNEAVSRHKELMNLIDTNNVYLSDLHNVLKIVKTLPLIEKYQSDKLPNTKSLEGFIKRQDEVLKQINNTIKR